MLHTIDSTCQETASHQHSLHSLHTIDSTSQETASHQVFYSFLPCASHVLACSHQYKSMLLMPSSSL